MVGGTIIDNHEIVSGLLGSIPALLFIAVVIIAGIAGIAEFIANKINPDRKRKPPHYDE